MKNGRWTAVAVAAALAVGMAGFAYAGEGRGEGKRDAWRHRVREALRERRGKAFEFLASMQFTDAQRQVMLDKARAAAPIAEASRAEARRITAAAWAKATTDAAADRAALRAEKQSRIKALRARTWPQVEPLAKDVLASFTPEQRQKIADAAAKRGRPIDDARLTKLIGFMLTRPMTVPYLEARLGVTPK
jgi:hypothetical protein